MVHVQILHYVEEMSANSDGIATYCINSYYLYLTLHNSLNKKFTKKEGYYPSTFQLFLPLDFKLTHLA